jgi:ABC-type transport system involved in multi-copper enzyme maturation permease subunit
VLTQTGAIFLDAYRELNAKKMFWITLVLSWVIVAVFATVSINAQGFSVLWFNFTNIYNTTMIPAPMFFLFLFSHFGVGWWLNRIAIILALVSTAGIIPDFIAGGAVDLYLSKPIGRLRLFLTKYTAGLLFVALQVLIFAAASFCLIGFRSGTWDFKIFLAVPIAVIVFSYLFSVCVLVGLLTQSNIAALLLTILFWLMVSGISITAGIFQMNTIAGRIESEAYAKQFAFSDSDIARLKDRAAAGDQPAILQLKSTQAQRRDLEEKKRNTDPGRRAAKIGFSIFEPIRSILPKTAESSALLSHWMKIDTSDITEEQLQEREKRRAASSGWFSGFRDRTTVRFDDSDVLREMGELGDAQPASKILGSSLTFEAIILALTCWIFARRDY